MQQSQPGAGSSEAILRPGSARPRVIIVSDVLLYRQGLEASLVREGRLDVVDVISSREALTAIAGNLVQIVLLDAGAEACLDLARVLRVRMPRLRVVGFGISGGADRLVACAECGLAAFVDSNASVPELVEVSLGVLRGELACSPQVSALLCERLATLATAEQQPEALTRREREIATLIVEGLSNKEIAKDLSIGPSTVKNHVHNILEKLGVRRRAAIAHQLSVFPWATSNRDVNVARS